MQVKITHDIEPSAFLDSHNDAVIPGVSIVYDPTEDMLYLDEAQREGPYDPRDWYSIRRSATIDSGHYDGSVSRPSAEDIRDYLDTPAAQVILERIEAGAGSQWDGQRFVGDWTADADAALEELGQAIRDLPGQTYYIAWDLDQWFQGLDRDQIAAMSDEDIEAEADAEQDGVTIVFAGDPIAYLTSIRDARLAEMAEDA